MNFFSASYLVLAWLAILQVAVVNCGHHHHHCRHGCSKRSQNYDSTPDVAKPDVQSEEHPSWPKPGGGSAGRGWSPGAAKKWSPGSAGGHKWSSAKGSGNGGKNDGQKPGNTDTTAADGSGGGDDGGVGSVDFNPGGHGSGGVVPELADSKVIKTGTDTINGQFYSYYDTHKGGPVHARVGKAGVFGVDWTNCDNFVVGVGWKEGSLTRTMNFAANVKVTGSAYTSAYFWNKSPGNLLEVYITQMYGTYNPGQDSTKQLLGEYEADGTVYTLSTNMVHNQPSVLSQHSDFKQVWAVRKVPASSGSINIGEHAKAWAKHGIKLDDISNQVIAVEGFKSSGTARVQVW